MVTHRGRRFRAERAGCEGGHGSAVRVTGTARDPPSGLR